MWRGVSPKGVDMTIKEVRTKEPNQVLIDHFELQLERAKSGELQGHVGIIIFDDGTTSSAWVNPPKDYHTKIVSTRIIGEIEYMKAELMTSDWYVRRDEFFG